MPIGTVKWFNGEKGYGFIQPDEAGIKEVFVHKSAVEHSGLASLNEGQKIQYEMIEDKKAGRESACKLKAV